MDNIVNFANNIIFYTAAYAILLIFYGVALYALINGIVRFLMAAYRRVKADWMAWHQNKDDK